MVFDCLNLCSNGSNVHVVVAALCELKRGQYSNNLLSKYLAHFSRYRFEDFILTITGVPGRYTTPPQVTSQGSSSLMKRDDRAWELLLVADERPPDAV